MRILVTTLFVATAVFALTFPSTAGKPGLPDQGGIFTFASEADGLKVPPRGNFARKLLSDGTSSSVFAFKGSGAIGAHYHEKHDEIVYIVSGTAEFTLGTQTKKVGPGDVLVVPACTVHSVKFEEESQALIINAPEMDPATQDRVKVKDGETVDPYSACG